MIAGDLPAQAGDAVLEIGPGHGALTEHLLDRAVQLTAVEIDEQCVEFLEQKFQGRENFRIENIDFLKFDLQAFLEAHEKPWVTGNLPYNVSTAIIAGLMPKLHLTKGFMGMVQLEVAERICAAPCSSNYGSLSVLVSAYADTQILRKIGPEHFTPRPNVDSATMLLTPKADALQAPEGFFDLSAPRLRRNARRSPILSAAPTTRKKSRKPSSCWIIRRRSAPRNFPPRSFWNSIG